MSHFKLRYIFLIHNLIKFSKSTLKQWRSLNRKKLNFTKKTKINFKRPYLSRNNSTGKINLDFGLKWVLNYYYDGFTSWIYFYPSFYSPIISGSTSSPSISILTFFFLQPTQPFEKLMVCKKNSYQLNYFFCIKELMIGLESPIFDLYPLQAIYKIPFTYQKRILESIQPHEHKLLDEERRSNEFLLTQKFQHNEKTPFRDSKLCITCPAQVPHGSTSLNSTHPKARVKQS
ncbi:hypothetical protein VP01_1152g10 [Puccinia sorghi]|uniref:Xrn1 helical domain-containing protein n=1 Tax=Puccinia sorghi TaxID=27349 RepID=A0A0L6VRQ0_9BASI|nr:hypothetical protein VP01_1152g10 [Puccinia sorghi]